MPRAWNALRARQYEHTRDSLRSRWKHEDTSVQGIASGRSGGVPFRRGPGGRTKAQLYNEARAKGVKGRSTMNKAELLRAVGR